MNTPHRLSTRHLSIALVLAWVVAALPCGGTEPPDPDPLQDAGHTDARLLLDESRLLLEQGATNALARLREAADAFAREEDWAGMMEANLDLVEYAADKEEIRRATDEVSLLIEEVTYAPPELATSFFDDVRPLLDRAHGLRIPAAAALIGKNLREAGNSEQAFEWYTKAATMGYPPAQVQLGLMYSNGDGVETDMEKAALWLRPANRKKNAAGKHLLAECFLYGKGMQKKPEVAVQLLQEAISLDESGRSLDLLATCYVKGWGVEPDPRKAAQLYHQACESKYYNAYANLAVLYMKGDGVTRDEDIAIDLLHAGIEQGENPLCMYFLGLAHWEGKGIRKSKRNARKWLVRAAEAGSEQAKAWCITNDVAFTAP